MHGIHWRPFSGVSVLDVFKKPGAPKDDEPVAKGNEPCTKQTSMEAQEATSAMIRSIATIK